MGLDIYSSDEVKCFHIGYVSFTKMRSFFVIPYGKTVYDVYKKFIDNFGYGPEYVWSKLCEDIGDLSILINHSDCDGELTSNECKKLKECLFVDEKKIKKYIDGDDDYHNHMIEKMYEFIDIVEHCADNEDIKLIFG